MAALPPLRIRVRLFAMQREIAGTRELRLEVPPGSTVDDAWSAVVEVVPALAPGRAFLRFAVNGSYADPDTPLGDGDEIACIPPVSGGADEPASGGADEPASGGADEPASGGADEPASGGADEPASGGADEPASGGADEQAPAGDDGRRILEIRDAPFPADLVTDLADRLATDEDGGVVAFVGRTRVTPGTPAPGQEAEAGRHAGRVVEELEYEAFDPMALAVLGQIADEIEARWDVRRLAIVHRTGPVPLGEPSVVVVAVAPHRDAAFAAARYAIDETKARAPIWKAERFEDGHVWVGDPARSGPAEPA